MNLYWLEWIFWPFIYLDAFCKISLRNSFHDWTALWAPRHIFNRNFFNSAFGFIEKLIFKFNLVFFEKLWILSRVWIIHQVDILLIYAKLLFVYLWHVELRPWDLWIWLHLSHIFESSLFQKFQSFFEGKWLMRIEMLSVFSILILVCIQNKQG